MPKTLIAPTEDFIKQERTKVSGDASAGSSVSLSIDNSDGISANDYVVVGYEGSEAAELQQVSSVTDDTTIVVGTLKFAHKKGEPVTKYRYNQRKFYGATSKTGTYNHLSSDGSPKTIQPDDPQGALLEYTGNEGYTFFKATYYNAQTGDETSTDDATAVEADESKRYCSIYAIRKKCGIVDNPFYSDLDVERKRLQAENEINSAVFARYVLPLSEIPPLIQNVCELLAAGYIDYEEFREEGEGKKWLGEARGILKAVMDGRQRLLASDNTELSRNAKVGNIQGYPDDSIDAGSADDRKFKISDKY